MASNKKPTSSSFSSKPIGKPAVAAKPAAPAATTPVRNTAIPRPQAAAPAAKQITGEQIAKRAYEIWQSGTGGSEYDNWVRAERELRGG